jgi:hypothetical protein
LFGEELDLFAKNMDGKAVFVGQIFDILLRLKDVIHDVGPDGIFDYIIDQLGP